MRDVVKFKIYDILWVVGVGGAIWIILFILPASLLLTLGYYQRVMFNKGLIEVEGEVIGYHIRHAWYTDDKHRRVDNDYYGFIDIRMHPYENKTIERVARIEVYYRYTWWELSNPLEIDNKLRVMYPIGTKMKKYYSDETPDTVYDGYVNPNGYLTASIVMFSVGTALFLICSIPLMIFCPGNYS